MGRKKSRDKYVSQGLRKNVSRRWLKLTRKDNDDRLFNQWDAFMKGKNVMLTIPNPNTNETNKPFVRVNAKDVWKFNKPYIMKQNTSESV